MDLICDTECQRYALRLTVHRHIQTDLPATMKKPTQTQPDNEQLRVLFRLQLTTRQLQNVLFLHAVNFKKLGLGLNLRFIAAPAGSWRVRAANLRSGEF